MYPLPPLFTHRHRHPVSHWLRAILGLILLVAGVAGFGLWAWNHSLTTLFALPPLTPRTALSLTALLLLLRVLLVPRRRWHLPRHEWPARSRS